MKDLNSLAVFAKVVESKSFSTAARHLGMPVSTVSRRIADLEHQLGVRLLERTTRSLRVTEVGAELFEHARQSAEMCEAVDQLISNRLSKVSGTLRLAAPPSISDSLIMPVIGAFRASYPNVRVHIRITERIVDPIADDVDLAFKVGTSTDASLTARILLSYRHQVVASPRYLATCEVPKSPRDLLGHRLLAFSFWKPEYSWSFVHADGEGQEAVTFEPCIATNDYAALTVALLAAVGIGELPPIVRPELIANGHLVEVMPLWHLPRFDLTIAHLRNGHMQGQVRAFKEFATQMVPRLFPALPT